jgi:hypothetical protein
MEIPKIDPNLDNQIKFVEFMIETNNIELLVAIKNSLLELKSIKDSQKDVTL